MRRAMALPMTRESITLFPYMIKYYLGEDAILKNAPTYLAFYEKDRNFILEHSNRLVVKDSLRGRRIRIAILRKTDTERKKNLRNSSRLLSTSLAVSSTGGSSTLLTSTLWMRAIWAIISCRERRHLRAFVLTESSRMVWPSGLTRFSESGFVCSKLSLREEDLRTHGYYLVRKSRSPVLA